MTDVTQILNAIEQGDPGQLKMWDFESLVFFRVFCRLSS